MENPVILNFDNGTLMQVSNFSRIIRTKYGCGIVIYNQGDNYTVTFKSVAEREAAIQTILDRLNSNIIDIKGTQPNV